jgi:hypothetical protein
LRRRCECGLRGNEPLSCASRHFADFAFLAAAFLAMFGRGGAFHTRFSAISNGTAGDFFFREVMSSIPMRRSRVDHASRRNTPASIASCANRALLS